MAWIVNRSTESDRFVRQHHPWCPSVVEIFLQYLCLYQSLCLLCLTHSSSVSIILNDWLCLTNWLSSQTRNLIRCPFLQLAIHISLLVLSLSLVIFIHFFVAIYTWPVYMLFAYPAILTIHPYIWLSLRLSVCISRLVHFHFPSHPQQQQLPAAYSTNNTHLPHLSAPSLDEHANAILHCMYFLVCSLLQYALSDYRTDKRCQML